MLKEFSYPTLIAEATRLRGDTTFFSAAHIFGVVEGNIIQQALDPIQIGKSGWVHGSITSQGTIVIAGRVDGDIISKTKIQLLPTAVVRGTLDAALIQVMPGAILEGTLRMKHRVDKHSSKEAA